MRQRPTRPLLPEQMHIGHARNSMVNSNDSLPLHPFPNAGLSNNADTQRVAARSAAACSSAGANACMRSTFNRARGPAMLITPSAALPRSHTGAAIAVMPGAKTSSIIEEPRSRAACSIFSSACTVVGAFGP
jgi:hypothetical protein